MLMAMVAGTIIASVRNDGVPAPVYLLVDRCDAGGRRKGDYLVALDLIGAGQGELVLISQGSSARMTESTENKPFDAVVIGIVDEITRAQAVLYRK